MAMGHSLSQEPRRDSAARVPAAGIAVHPSGFENDTRRASGQDDALMNARRAWAYSTGWLMWGTWPAPTNVRRPAPGMAFARRSMMGPNMGGLSSPWLRKDGPSKSV